LALSIPAHDANQEQLAATEIDPGELAADTEQTPPQLQAARDVIDELDCDLLDLLVRRAELSLRAAQAKAKVGRGIRDAGREQKLLNRRRDMADRRELDQDAVVDIFQAILRFSRAHQAHSQS